MSLDFNFSLEELEAAEAATVNPHLSDPTRGMQLLARLVGRPAPEAVQEAQRAHLARLHTLIHQDFIALTARGSYPGEAQALRQLLALEDAMENLALFPDLAGKTVVGVGGGFSAGKSRFLNTLLGVNLLPEALEPTTAIPSFITRGEVDIVALNTFNQRIPLDRDALQAITHAFNEHYRDSLGEGFGFAHLLKLLILHQATMPWDNLAFLDTPGYSKPDAESAVQTDRRIALKQLGEADQVLWLLSAQNGSIRQDDLEFLHNLDHPKPIFFVVTQADLRSDIQAILGSARQAIEQAGIPYAGLMAWAAPLSNERGERIAGDDIRAWLEQLNSHSKYTQHRRTCEQVLDSYIRHNQNSLAGSRKRLALLNTLLPLADRLPESERSTLQELIREQRQSQVVFKEQIEQFAVLKDEILEVVIKIVGELAVDAPSSDELFQQALQHHDQKQYELAATYFLHAAELGHATAQFSLAAYYDAGIGVAQDSRQAADWYSKAAQQDHADAQFNLGFCYANGVGVPHDQQKAIDWYQKAAAQDHPEAQFHLLRLSATQGNKNAQYALAICYETGKGTAKDIGISVEWYRAAAKAGLADAQLKVAEHYLSGEFLTKNSAHAKSWLQKSAAQGNPAAKALLEKLRKPTTLSSWWNPLGLNQ